MGGVRGSVRGAVKGVKVRGVEELLPRYDRREVHRRWYAASPAAVRAALESVAPADLPLTRILLAVRGVLRHPASTGPMLERMARSGFARLVDTPEEMVFGVVGKFWRPDGGRRPAVPDAAAFRAFAEPGFAKAVMSFELRPAGAGTEVVTETRIAGTSAGARRLFALYWIGVRGGSGLIRRELLAAAGRRLVR